MTTEVDYISLAISCFSALVALAAIIITFYQVKRGWYIDAVSKQRLDWAENLRNALARLIEAFYHDDDDLRSARDTVFIYLNPNNTKHQELIKATASVCNRETDSLDTLIKEAQKLLNLNWKTVKAESKTSLRYEKKRDADVEKRCGK